MLADTVEGVGNFAVCLPFDSGEEALHELLVADAVVEDDVTFCGVDEGFHMLNAVAGDGDDRMDVREAGELDGEGADGRGAAIDDEGDRECGGVPGKRKVQALVKSVCGGHGSEGKGSALYKRSIGASGGCYGELYLRTRFSWAGGK